MATLNSGVIYYKFLGITGSNILGWVIKNWIIVLVGLLAVILLFGSKLRRKLFGHRRVKHRPGWGATHTRSGKLISGKTKSGKSIPRSVGKGKKGYPAAGGGYIPFKYNKDKSIKKAAFVAGTQAAKTRMAHLRKMK